MNISAPFVRRPVATSLMAAALMLAGVLAFLKLPVAALPRVEPDPRTGKCFRRTFSRPSSAQFASAGEMIPPCGVPETVS